VEDQRILQLTILTPSMLRQQTWRIGLSQPPQNIAENSRFERCIAADGLPAECSWAAIE
jgi:hypothetical protein